MCIYLVLFISTGRGRNADLDVLSATVRVVKLPFVLRQKRLADLTIKSHDPGMR